ncbi:MAG: hypothetical protein ABI208_04135, partial [Ginsengibacter sp.]
MSIFTNKNSTVQSKTFCTLSSYRMLLVFLFLIVSAQIGIAQTTFTSNPAGGDWNLTTTWVGGIVPSGAAATGNSVVIDGPVNIVTNLSSQYLNITIKAGKTLTVGAGGSITSNRLLTNNGTLTITTGRTLTIDFEGRVINNGIINIDGAIVRGTTFEALSTYPNWGWSDGPWDFRNNVGGVINLNVGGSLTWNRNPTTFNANINNDGTIIDAGTFTNANATNNILMNNGILQLNE